MAYISEIKSRDDPSSASDYVEIVLLPGETLSDFSISVYRRNGTFLNEIELTSATLTGTGPTGQSIYSISTNLWEGASSSGPAAVALESDVDGLLQFIAVGTVDVSPTIGIASGQTATGVGNAVAGDSHFWSPDGTYLGVGPSTPGVICFVSGVSIETNQGPRKVEQLFVGDKILTRDNGYQEIAWIGQSTRSELDLYRTPSLRPIEVRKDAFGPNCPHKKTSFSPQHHLLIQGAQADCMFGEAEVLIAAKHLKNDHSIIQSGYSKVTYFHLMFEKHQIIKSDGLWSESFLPAEYSISTLEPHVRAEFELQFPQFKTLNGSQFYQSSRIILRKHEAMILKEANK